MMNLSCLSKARMAALAMGIIAIGGGGMSFFNPPTIIYPFVGVVVVGLAVFAFFQIEKSQKMVRRMIEVSKAIRHGDFDQRAIFPESKGDVREMIDELNEMINVTDAFVRESALAMEAASEGRFYRKIRPEGMEGAFLGSVNGINSAIEQMAGRDEMVERAIAEVNTLVTAASEGHLEQRIEPEKFTGAYRKLANGMNSLLEAVAQPIEEAGDVLAGYAATDLSQRVRGSYKGIFGKLKDDTNAVGDKLAEVIGNLRETSHALKTATGEILAGANDLSERTTKQAATVEETSATMEQLSATVLDNAKMAEEVSANAAEVARAAGEGGEIMERANQAMERITSSSSKISNIIGMIDDIAFQTNLLALNASVEAARAGEAGKGFAVVAVEVRRLAQSAATASNDVKELIEQSAEEVGQGTELVSVASEKLSSMMEGAKSNTAIMGRVAAASREQASSIEEVNAAVRQMDEMTQHNAALVEQTNAAIEQTDNQVVELDRIVDVFKLNGREKSATAPGAPSMVKSSGGDARVSQGKAKEAAKSYLSEGSAALDTDWAEF